MKNRVQFHSAILLAGLTLLGVPPARSAPPDRKVDAGTPTVASNAIPQSIFTVPTGPKQGRNPFFPNSTGGYTGGTPTVVKPSTPALPEIELKLNGLGGTADHRLAMINNRTLAQGEHFDFPTASGHVRVRCVEIKAESVVVDVNGQRRELRLPD